MLVVKGKEEKAPRRRTSALLRWALPELKLECVMRLKKHNEQTLALKSIAKQGKTRRRTSACATVGFARTEVRVRYETKKTQRANARCVFLVAPRRLELRIQP